MTRASEELESVEAGSHLCLLYETVSEQVDVALPFLRGGWLRGERSVCITGRQGEDRWLHELQTLGADVDFASLTAPILIGTHPAFPGPSQFSSVSMARTVWGFVQDSLISFGGVRFAVDMDSNLSISRELAADELCHWEATLDHLHDRETPLSTICMYNRAKLSPAQVHAALRTHAYVLVGGRLCLNSFYEAAEILEHEPHLNASNADADTVDRMIASLLADP